MPSYKLTYFNARARGELPRLLFAAAGQEFEDCRVEMEDWGKLKDKTPQGSMPLLEVDGGPMICQSQAVARYLARKFGLYGKTDEEAVVIDQIMDTALDLFNPFLPILFEAQEEQPKKIEEFYKTKGEKVLQFIENLFQGKNGFAVGETLSVADLYVFACIESVVQPISASLKDDKLLDKYPKLAAMKKTVENLPRIKKYLDARKPTPF